MTIPEAIIKQSVDRYRRERDRYLKLASRVEDICRSAIVEENAIRAQVTSRTKSIKSFEGKLKRFARRADKNYDTVDHVFEGIGDFSGVRIATYQPEDEIRVADLVAELFEGEAGGEIDIDRKDKLNPEQGSFYRATHCQVFLPETSLVGDYDNLHGVSCEIQICSMMAHVWNEIEHDIGYKPEGGGPAEAERGLLETLGHLARAGDAAITRLLAANLQRMEGQKGDFSDVYEFVAQIRPFFPDADLSVNAGVAFEAVQALNLRSLDKLKEAASAETFDNDLARQRIADLNAFANEVECYDGMLNPTSADVFTIGLLHRFIDDLDRKVKEDRKSYTTRLTDVISNFVEFRQVRS